jgi:hypothetical protein
MRSKRSDDGGRAAVGATGDDGHLRAPEPYWDVQI